MVAHALKSLVLVASCAACGGRATSSNSVDAGITADGASDAEAGSAAVNAPRPRLACGASSSCYVTDSGTVRCWGNGEFGQLGDGTIETAPLPPTTVQQVSDAIGLAGGPLQACAFDASDQAQCWGLLPSATPANLATPKLAPMPISLLEIATIAFAEHACAVTRRGRVYCWGPDPFLGNGEGPSDSPVQVRGIEDAVDVAVNRSSELGSGIATLVVLASGRMVGWGHAHGPGLGASASSDQLTPVPIPAPSNVRQITLGSNHACALLADAHVSCWGANGEGQLGVPLDNSPTTVPRLVAGLDDVAEVRAGDAFTCARRKNGEIWCWGDNVFSELAAPATVRFSRAPVRIDVPPVTDLGVGQGHVCVRTSDDSVMCWGNNTAGEVMLPVTSSVAVPTRVTP